MEFRITREQAIAFWGAVNDDISLGVDSGGDEIGQPKAREAQALIFSIWGEPSPNQWRVHYAQKAEPKVLEKVSAFFRALADALDPAQETMTREALIEALADKEHASWARWMLYLFDQCIEVGDGNYEIPRDKVERWNRQAITDYCDLSEAEKESDRKEVEHILPIIDAYKPGER